MRRFETNSLAIIVKVQLQLEYVVKFRTLVKLLKRSIHSTDAFGLVSCCRSDTSNSRNRSVRLYI